MPSRPDPVAPAGSRAPAATPDAPAATRPLSIGLVSPAWPVEAFQNGVVTYVAALGPALRAHGHAVSVLAHTVAGGGSEAQLYDAEQLWRERSRARRLVDALCYRIAPRAADRLIWRRLAVTARRMASEQRLDVLEMEEAFGASLWVGRTCAVPIVVRLHGPWFLNGAALGLPQDRAFQARVRLEGRALGAAAAVSAPSRDVLERAQAFYGLSLERAVVIPNPVQPPPASERWTVDGCDPRRILFVGRFDRHKGGDVVVEAFGRVRREIPDARLSFVGADRGFRADGGRTWQLAEFARDRLPGALESGAVELLGQQPFGALAGLRRRAMVTVVSSRYENFPGTVTEAMAAGCPVVASSAGGIPEIVEDGANGLLHRAGDPDDLAAKIVALVRDPARAARLGAQAEADCRRRFHPSAIASTLAGFYRDVIEG